MAERAYGMLGEFESPEALLAAARYARAAGYRELDAFTPFPVEGLAQVLKIPRPWISLVGLIGTLAGAGTALLMQMFVSYDYPLNVGGRPIYALSAFAVVTFELTILCSALAMLIVMLWQNGLPRLNYPVFAAPRFHLASKDRFFLCVKSEDPMFDDREIAAFLTGLGAASVERVPS
ncbi:DUF3341 domain-containing protein [Bradyrhizobium sp. CCBAU 53421]|uniref:DUF3341 domain-containing protein n=1 Tax=Bradyrhizobium sp. CCBAU 53421 TaxID=1325120 RepID=UPI001889F4B6|nr:DUF3341 domain-containing protein [Bradyrhizobium sp. CCBAU 53421]QOZ32883.1 DUF3341 domain-containing protein [Bradyrhizobium sp. CCBAU 53421]